MLDWQAFLGWNLIIQWGILLLAALFVMGASDWVVRIHRKFIDLPREKLLVSYWWFLAVYKVLIIMFLLGPYVVLRWLM